MTSRHWKGTVKPNMADAYVRHLKTETLPQLSAVPGFVSATILRRPVEEGTEFQVVTLWESLTAIAAFAGEDVEVAVVPATAQAMMTEFDRRVTHYEVVEHIARG
jgi:heme-degrading monooxygenase HmoA